MIYISNPYTAEDHALMFRRYWAARTYALHVIDTENRTDVFSPIVWGHTLVDGRPDLVRDAHFWAGLWRSTLPAATEMRILTLRGWESSTGVGLEIAESPKGCKIYTVSVSRDLKFGKPERYD